MELAVEAFAQREECHSVEMEIVAASWASAQRQQKRDDDQGNKPADK